MTAIDRERLDRLRAAMREENVDLLICRLPENVVYLTDYWPHHGVSVAILPKDGAPEVFVPEVEAEWAEQGWATVRPFGWSLVKDDDLYANYRRVLAEYRNRPGLGRGTVAVELAPEIVGPSYRSAEPIVPAAPWRELLAEVLDRASIVDSTALLAASRRVKSAIEVERLRVAAEIAEAGIRYAMERIEPGMTEAQIGALVEGHARANGPGYKGARLVRCSAEVAAGANSAKAVLLIPSTGKVVAEGDLVMIEVGTVVDGYWSDLTYMSVAGRTSERQREIHNAVLEAERAAIAALKPGTPSWVPDERARTVLARAGLGEYFPHITGHGIGLRYHEQQPLLMPGSGEQLESGMYTSVEPGVYIPGFGGVRIEDNVLVTEDGPLVLSTPREPW